MVEQQLHFSGQLPVLLIGTVLGVLQTVNIWQACGCQDSKTQQNLEMGFGGGTEINLPFFLKINA